MEPDATASSIRSVTDSCRVPRPPRSGTRRGEASATAGEVHDGLSLAADVGPRDKRGATPMFDGSTILPAKRNDYAGRSFAFYFVILIAFRNTFRGCVDYLPLTLGFFLLSIKKPQAVSGSL